MHKCSILLSKAVSATIREASYEPVDRKDENFVYIQGSNFGVAWDRNGYCEVITNYTKNGKWEALQSNPVCGKIQDCVAAAVRKTEYWSKRRAS